MKCEEKRPAKSPNSIGISMKGKAIMTKRKVVSTTEKNYFEIILGKY